MAEKRKWTATELINLLRKRFSEPGRYAVLEQVGNSTGFGCSTWIDAMVVHLWPSDGLQRHAYEVKVSRSDFLREIADPSKNREFKASCHAFSFIAPSDVIKEQELPEGVGWLKPHGDGLSVVRAASIKENPPLNAGFLAAIVRATKKDEKAERERIRQEILAEDPVYARYKRYAEVGEAFLTRRGLHRYQIEDTKEALMAAFERATVSDEDAKRREQINGFLAKFRGNMFELFERFCEVANLSLLEVDETGKFIAHAYGSEEQAAKARDKYARERIKRQDERDRANRETIEQAASARHNRLTAECPPDPMTDIIGNMAALELKPDAGPSLRAETTGPVKRVKSGGMAKLRQQEEAEERSSNPTTVTKPATKPLTKPVVRDPVCSRCGIPCSVCPCPPGEP